MRRIKFLGLCLLLATTSLYAKDLVIVTDKNTIDGNVKVNVLKHDSYSYDSIDLYQDNLNGVNTLLGNYGVDGLSDTIVPISTEYKQSVIKGVINNPQIVNAGSEVYLKTNLPYCTVEGNEIEWGYLFSGLGDPTSVLWTITSYNESEEKVGLKKYSDIESIPKTLDVGTHIVKLDYYDFNGTHYESIKTVKINRKVEREAKILVDDKLKAGVKVNWKYSFNGIVKKVNWYINDELHETPPQRLESGTYTLKLEVITDLDEVYTVSKEVIVEDVVTLDVLMQGGVPEGTKISTTAPTYQNTIANIINGSMYNGWSASSNSAVITLEFPYEIDIDMFELARSSNPACTQTVKLSAYSESGELTQDPTTFSFQSYDIRNISEENLLKSPEKIYISWDNLTIKNCKKLVLNYNANQSWVGLRYIGFGYTESN